MKKILLSLLFLLSPLSWSHAAPTCPPPDQCKGLTPCGCDQPEPDPPGECVPDPKGAWFCAGPAPEH